VVAARAGAIPEVTGDAALLVDPDDPEGLAESLRRALDDPELRGDLVARGHARVGYFSWSAMADEMIALYRKLRHEVGHGGASRESPGHWGVRFVAVTCWRTC